jgi:deoxyribodipyrimidine photo-lyase
MTITSYAALELYICGIDAATYAERRNYIGGSTRLSEYITRGVISLPRVRELVLANNTEQSAYKLLQELAWREYWQQTWRVRGDEIFSAFRPLPPRRRGLPTNILTASTGITAIDSGLQELYQTGYIHNHMRMWLAGLICNVAQCDWRVGADWMMTYLIDGDYASNHLSWQWCAGAYTGKPYLPQQDNINTYTETFQKGTYLDQTYDQIAGMPIPEQLAAITLPESLQRKPAQLPLAVQRTDISSLSSAPVQLYSPWTLDPTWRSDATGIKVLAIDEDFFDGSFSQQVLDSIVACASWIPDLHFLRASAAQIKLLQGEVYRKDYPAIRNWPGVVTQSDRLFSDIPEKFFPSFSSFWKQTQNSQQQS